MRCVRRGDGLSCSVAVKALVRTVCGGVGLVLLRERAQALPASATV